MPQPIITATLGQRWGASIAQRRKDLGLTQQQLADLCGVEQQTISRAENGTTIPRFDLLFTICRYLGTKPEALYPWPELGELLTQAS